MIDLTPILQAGIVLIATIVTVIIVPYIKNKTTNEKRIEIESWIKIAVLAAEQIIRGSGKGEDKKQFVKDWLVENGYVLNIDAITSDIDVLIEAAVYELKK